MRSSASIETVGDSSSWIANSDSQTLSSNGTGNF